MSDNNGNMIADNRRIAKNTAILYLRSIIMLLISLYTSRVILQTLGVSDYGIIGAVAGAVGMFSMVTNSFTGAISRFITFELGKGGNSRLNTIFCTSVNTLYILSAIIILLGLTLGLWFLNTTMNIPAERLTAANWVMVTSVVSMVIAIQCTPYTATIVAHEHMSAFAYLNIIEAVLKLAIVFLLQLGEYDKLILYSLLMLGVSITMRLAYIVFCRKKYPECKYHAAIDKGTMGEMFGFAGWTGLNGIVYTFNKQGVEMLINVFFGVVYNAARSIATQVEGMINQFVGNFTSAMSPQITKLYAAGEKEQMFTLICRGAKFSYFLLLFFALPVFFEAETLLDIWLGTYPEKAILFIRLSLLLSMAYMTGNTLLTGCFAVGKIRSYSIAASIVSSFLFIGTLILYHLGFRMEWTYAIGLAVLLMMTGARLAFLHNRIGFPISMFFKTVLLRLSVVTIIAVIIPIAIYIYITPGLFRLILTIIGTTAGSALTVYYLGLDSKERNKVVLYIMSKFRKNV